MSLGEELSKIDLDKAGDIYDVIFNDDETGHSKEFVYTELEEANQRFPIFLYLQRKVIESGMENDFEFTPHILKGIDMGMDIVKMVFAAYAASEIPDTPPPQEEKL